MDEALRVVIAGSEMSPVNSIGEGNMGSAAFRLTVRGKIKRISGQCKSPYISSGVLAERVVPGEPGFSMLDERLGEPQSLSTRLDSVVRKDPLQMGVYELVECQLSVRGYRMVSQKRLFVELIGWNFGLGGAFECIRDAGGKSSWSGSRAT
nr:hypothetical protein Iba_chr06aCG9250 [Ipomoea batatas]